MDVPYYVVHSMYDPSATTIYSSEKATYDALTHIPSITKRQESFMPQLRADGSTHQIAETSGPRVTGGHRHGAKRVHEADTREHQINV